MQPYPIARVHGDGRQSVSWRVRSCTMRNRILAPWGVVVVRWRVINIEPSSPAFQVEEKKVE